MALVRIQLNAANQREIAVVISTLDDVFGGQHADRLTQIEQAIIRVFLEQKITLEYEAWRTRLIQLAIDAVLDQDLTRFTNRLNDWAQQYKAFDSQSEERLRSLAAFHARGVGAVLFDEKRIDYQLYGNDIDIRIILRDVMISHPSEISSSGIYVCSPISLDEQGVLKNRADEFAKAHPEKNLDLYMLVNCGQNHWKVARLRLLKGVAQPPVFWDPLVDGKQKNGHSCMDYCTQYVLSKLDQLDTGLQAIVGAGSEAEAIREAIAFKMLENHEQTPEQAQAAKAALVAQREQYKRDMAVLANVDCNKDDGEYLHQLLVANNQLREEFDVLMAAKLNKLYGKIEPSDAVSEETFVQQARRYARAKLLGRHGIFPATPSLRRAHSPIDESIAVEGPIFLEQKTIKAH